MGMFDTFVGKDGTEVQVKIGPNLLNVYREGDHVSADFPDAVIFGNEGCIVIRGGVAESVTEKMPENLDPKLPRITKWGGPFDPETDSMDDHNPIVQAFKYLRESQGATKPKSEQRAPRFKLSRAEKKRVHRSDRLYRKTYVLVMGTFGCDYLAWRAGHYDHRHPAMKR